MAYLRGAKSANGAGGNAFGGLCRISTIAAIDAKQRKRSLEVRLIGSLERNVRVCSMLESEI